MKRKFFKYMSCITLLISINTFTGCTIPFQRFLQEDEAIVKDIKIEGIDIDKETIPYSEIEEMQKVVSNIFDKIANYDFYYENYDNLESFHLPIKEYTDDNFYKELISKGSDFKKVVDNIYYKDDTKYKTAKIIEVGITTDKKYYKVEVVSIDDSMTFGAETINLIVNSENKIIGTELVGEMNTVQNTTKPIDSESLIPNDNKLFSKKLNEFLNQLKNEELYKKVSSGEDKVGIDVQIEALISNIKLQNKNNEALKDLFKAGKGIFKDITHLGFNYNDYGALGVSNYIIAFANGEEIIKFNIEYSRVSEEIIGVKKI